MIQGIYVLAQGFRKVWGYEADKDSSSRRPLGAEKPKALEALRA